MAAIQSANGLWRLLCIRTPYLLLCPPRPPPLSTAHIESGPSDASAALWCKNCWPDGRMITVSVREAKAHGSRGRIALVPLDSFAEQTRTKGDQ